MTKNATVSFLILSAIRNEGMCSRQRLCEFVRSNVEFSVWDEDTKAITALIYVGAIQLNESADAYVPAEYFKRTYDNLQVLHAATLAVKHWGLAPVL